MADNIDTEVFRPAPNAPDRSTKGPSMATEIRQLALVKKGQHFLFRYQPGDEAGVVQALMEKAEDPNCPLNWFDAAILSHRLGHRMASELETILKAKLGLGDSYKKAADAT